MSVNRYRKKLSDNPKEEQFLKMNEYAWDLYGNCPRFKLMRDKARPRPDKYKNKRRKASKK